MPSRFFTARSLAVLAALSSSLSACGGGSADPDEGRGQEGGRPTPPADVCALLTQADVQTILPSAGVGMPTESHDEPEMWTRVCSWQGAANERVGLVVDGALTEMQRALLDFLITTGPSDTVTMPVPGLGDNAGYFAYPDAAMLLAREGYYVVGIDTRDVAPVPSVELLEPLVRKVLEQL